MPSKAAASYWPPGRFFGPPALPVELPSAQKQDPESFTERGGSAIIAPDGRYLAGPVFEEEAVLCADLDLSEIDRECMTLDVSGHYSRPDVFELKVTAPSKRP